MGTASYMAPELAFCASFANGGRRAGRNHLLPKA
jgi:hypothetical protein